MEPRDLFLWTLRLGFSTIGWFCYVQARRMQRGKADKVPGWFQWRVAAVTETRFEVFLFKWGALQSALITLLLGSKYFLPTLFSVGGVWFCFYGAQYSLLRESWIGMPWSVFGPGMRPSTHRIGYRILYRVVGVALLLVGVGALIFGAGGVFLALARVY